VDLDGESEGECVWSRRRKEGVLIEGKVDYSMSGITTCPLQTRRNSSEDDVERISEGEVERAM
jgi:hypothetical protein